jgi:cysteine desulfuration protein SufE
MASTSQLIEDFELLDDWEERYRYIIELGRALPAMDEAFKTASTKVSGCASQVWIRSQIVPVASGRGLALQGDSDALIVKGLIAIVFGIVEGLSLQDIVALDPQSLFSRIGLADHLTPQRSNGLASMVKRIKADAAAALNDGAHG